MAGELEPLELAEAVGNGHQVPEHDVWRAPCMTREGARALFIKRVNTRKLLVELFCSHIGRALDLPIPKPFVVIVRPGRLSPGQPARLELMFGSQDQAHPSLAIITRDRERVVSLLRRWTKAPQAAAFDAFIANEDRTTRNWLYGAAEHAIWLIDHEDALRETTAPDDATRNELLSMLLEGKSEFELHKLLKDTEAFAGKSTALRLDQLSGSDVIPAIAQAQKHADALVSFLTSRRASLPNILRSQINPRQGALPLREQPSSASQQHAQSSI